MIWDWKHEQWKVFLFSKFVNIIWIDKYNKSCFQYFFKVKYSFIFLKKESKSKCRVINEDDTYAKLEGDEKIPSKVKLRDQKAEFCNSGQNI